MHVLFIGGTGLISTAIARQLLEAGHKVTLFNRGKTESRLPDGAESITGNRGDAQAFIQTFSDKTYDVVVDMVAFHPNDTEGAIKAFKGRTGQYIFCSTVCVYSGPVATIPTPETEPYHSIGGYGKNKALCEEMLLREFEAGFPITIMRPSHTFGEGGIIVRAFGTYGDMPLMVDRMRKGKPVIVPGNGNSMWAALHVDDAARGFIATMGNEKCLGQAYNITADEWMSWNMYHEQVAEVVGGTFDPVHIPTDVLLRMAPDHAGVSNEIFEWPSIFDNNKLKRDTAYAGQTIPFKAAVGRTLAWLEANGRVPDSDTNDYEDRLIAAWRGAIDSIAPVEKS
jgi:nucleoside-diphosphate-sugar epimerase